MENYCVSEAVVRFVGVIFATLKTVNMILNLWRPRNKIMFSIFKMKQQQQHDIEFVETSEKNPSPRWDLNPRPFVI